MLLRESVRTPPTKPLGLRGITAPSPLFPPRVLNEVELAIGLRVCTVLVVAAFSSHELTPLVVESVQLSDRLLLVAVVMALSLLSLRSPFTSGLLELFSVNDVSVPESRLPPNELDLSFELSGTDSSLHSATEGWTATASGLL